MPKAQRVSKKAGECPRPLDIRRAIAGVARLDVPNRIAQVGSFAYMPSRATLHAPPLTRAPSVALMLPMA